MRLPQLEHQGRQVAHMFSKPCLMNWHWAPRKHSRATASTQPNVNQETNYKHPSPNSLSFRAKCKPSGDPNAYGFSCVDQYIPSVWELYTIRAKNYM